jgi:inhibitor of KinA
MRAPRFLALGDAAVVVEFGSEARPDLAAQVLALDAAVRAEILAGRLAGVVEAVPTLRSLAVLYDARVARGDAIEARLAALLDGLEARPPSPGRSWTLPVWYGGVAGPDLEHVARAARMTAAEVVAAHAAERYTVHAMGFLPGFAFMGEVPVALRLPRRKEPRTAVPRGSVAIAGAQTAIYPLDSPGGWHLLGRCPVPPFDHRRAEPSLFAPGDRVRFEAVDEDAFREVQRALAADPSATEAYLR